MPRRLNTKRMWQPCFPEPEGENIHYDVTRREGSELSHCQGGGDHRVCPLYLKRCLELRGGLKGENLPRQHILEMWSGVAEWVEHGNYTAQGRAFDSHGGHAQ